MSATTTTVLTEAPSTEWRGQEGLELGNVGQTETSQNVHLPVFSRFSKSQKRLITFFLAYCGLLGTISTTSIFAALPEIVQTYSTTASVISISNAIYLTFMGISSCIWGPAADIFGRRPVYLCSTILFSAFSLGTALSPNLAAFFVCRAFTAAQGTSFLILGSSCISDIYHPTERATSLGWFLSGTMTGPAFGPLLGGIIVTYTSWRVIFWLQTALSVIAALMAYFVLSETLHNVRFTELKGEGLSSKLGQIWRWSNPISVVKLYRQTHLLLVILASSALVWNMYSLLTPIRYVLNPRLNLTTPLQSGLLYISPGAGYIIGTMVGGRWADFTTKSWMKKRGYRLPEDRLRSSLVFLGIILPVTMATYGWMVDERVGGIPVPVICMFFQGIAQLCAFTSLNAYILDVMQQRSGEASASHYMMRYCLAGVATAACLPLIDSIGVGWASTTSSALLWIATLLVYLTIRFGKSWRGA